eukprot:scaffold48398_cov74-Attheya_sp.AAC.3
MTIDGCDECGEGQDFRGNGSCGSHGVGEDSGGHQLYRLLVLLMGYGCYAMLTWAVVTTIDTVTMRWDQ